MIIDNPRISNIIFYPRKSRVPTELDPHIIVLKFKVNPTITLGGMLYLKDKNLPTILMFHGNGEVALEYIYFANEYFKCDINLAVVDYRGYGFSNGSPMYSSLITDALPVYHEFVKWMDENEMKDSLFIMGRSLGSTCASEIGGNNPERVKGIIFESGFGNLYNIFTGLFGIRTPEITPEVLEQFSNDTRMKRFKIPTLIIHGTEDYIIPVKESEIIYKALPESIKKWRVLIEGAGHNDISSFNEEYFSPLKEFIQEFQ